MRKTKYKVGDTLRVRNDLSIDMDFKSGLAEEMLELKGKLVKIEDAWQETYCNEIHDCYLLEEDKGSFSWNNEMFEEDVKQNTKDNQPKICEILGVEVGEKFNIIGNDKTCFNNPYYISTFNYGEIPYYDIENDEGNCLDTLEVIAIINGDFQVEKCIKKIELTDRQKEIFKALKVLGVNYITVDADGGIFVYTNTPIETDCKYWYDEIDDTYVYLTDYQGELSPFIEKAKDEPLDISTLDLD